MFYAAKNYYSSPTSVGFANTWYVVGFADRAARDAHVADCFDMATQPIKATQISQFGGKPKNIGVFDSNGQILCTPQ